MGPGRDGTDGPETPRRSPMDAGALTSRIRDRYPRFSTGERQVADLLLASPDLMSGSTATELAGSAGVSKATITRFVAKLDLGGFEEFRRAARTNAPHERRMHALGTPLQLMEQELATTNGDLDQLVAATLRSDAYNLNQTYAELSLDDLREAVRLLATSRHVIFADFRKQFALAYYAATLFRVIRPDVGNLPIPGASAVDGTLDLGEDDLVVMFPFRRPERDQDILSRAVLDAGATLVAIGDVWPNPANQRARLHFRCRTESTGVFDSFVTPISLINLLFTATANELGPQARDRLALLEDRHATFETFDPPSRRRS